jgi:hypothetical protein
MTAAEILSQLQAVGVGIRLHGDTLVCRPLRKVPVELAEQIRAHKPELVAILAEPAPIPTAPPVCPRCHQQNYMPLGSGWRRCWSCEWRWGPAGTQDPGDPPDLNRTAAVLGLTNLPRSTVFPRAGEQLASSSPEAAIDEAASDYPAGVLCHRDGCRGLGWSRDPESGGWRCRACGGPLPDIVEGWV